MAKRAKEAEPEAGIVQLADPVVEIPPESHPEPQPLPSSIGPSTEASAATPRETPFHDATGPSFGQRVGRFAVFLLRVISLLILLSLLSLALYITLPWLYQKFITPVEQNTAQVKELQSRLQKNERDLAALQSRLETLQTAQNQHDGSLTELDIRLSNIESEITVRTQSLTALEKVQSELLAQNKANSAELERQVNLLKAMELLSRARLFMYESNFGMARQDVQIARDLLSALQPQAPESLAKDLDEVLRRLDLTLTNLPDFPVAASDDLDIAWQVLLAGLPEGQATGEVTPAPPVTPSPTPIATTFTATLQPTIAPTTTP